MKRKTGFLLVIVLLAAACGAPPFEATSTPIPSATPDPTTTKTPTSTPTPEPSPTLVIEYDAPDKAWLEEVIFPRVREVGCEPTYKVSYYPETVSIPWTIDEDGNTVQGVDALDFCGDGGDSYIGFYKRNDGVPQRLIFEEESEYRYTLGPTHQIVAVRSSIPEDYVGFLDAGALRSMQKWFVCMDTYAPENDVYPEILAPGSDSAARSLSEPGFSWAPTDLSLYDKCK